VNNKIHNETENEIETRVGCENFRLLRKQAHKILGNIPMETQR
jgi:hypothetical protein